VIVVFDVQGANGALRDQTLLELKAPVLLVQVQQKDLYCSVKVS
jgi:hypothetical protein